MTMPARIRLGGMLSIAIAAGHSPGAATAQAGKPPGAPGGVQGQVKEAPESVPLLQAQAALQRATGQTEKARETLRRIVRLRPDDAPTRYQLANELVQAGDAAGSIEHYKAALKQDPSLFAGNYWQVQNAFQQAGRADDLAALLEVVDLKAIRQSWAVTNVATTLIQDPKTRDQGLRIFRRTWEAFPQDRPTMLGNFYDDQVWQLPEIYQYARQALIPAAGQKPANPWLGIDQFRSYGGGGKVSGVTDHMLDAAARQGKLDELGREVERALKGNPSWSGGKGLLAMIRGRMGRVEEAGRLVKGLLDNAKAEPIPYFAQVVIGQEIEQYGPLADLTLRLYEAAFADANTGNAMGLAFDNNPAKRLVEIYRKAGRLDDARDLVLKYGKPNDQLIGYDSQYASYTRVTRDLGVGEQLLDLGFPADAVPFFNALLADPDAMRTAQVYFGGGNATLPQRVGDDLARAMRDLKGDALPRTLRTLLKPADAPSPTKPALDLAIVVQPREVDRATVASLLAEVIRGAGRTPETKALLSAGVAKLLDRHPEDVSVRVVAALAAGPQGEPGGLAEAAARLSGLLDRTPLAPLKPEDRPDDRRRAEAAGQVGVWLVARECLRSGPTREVGDALGHRALDAARRQVDPRLALAILREWGQIDADRGDRRAAEANWSRMIDLATAEGSPAAPQNGKVPAPTLERFEMAAQAARLAADRGLAALSLRAIREALRNGPPVIPAPAEANAGRRFMQPAGPADAGRQTMVARQVEERFAELEPLWRQAHAPAAEVYEVLRDAVLPGSGPGEVFLYPHPDFQADRPARSVGAMLARWAVLAGRADDLRSRLGARSGPATELPAQVLLAQLGIAARDPGPTARALDSLARRLPQGTPAASAILASHAALPALEDPATAAPALAVLERVAQGLAAGPAAEPLAGIELAMAAAYFKAGDPAQGRRRLDDYLGLLDRPMPQYGGDYGLYVRKQNLARVAVEAARFGRADDALDFLGRFADAPAYRGGGDPPAGIPLAAIARSLATRPARERFDRLKAWTLPAGNRGTVRMLTAFVPEGGPPAVFGTMPEPGGAAGVVGNVPLLIAAAREVEELDALVKEVRPLADRGVANAPALLLLLQVAQGRDVSFVPRLKVRLADVDQDSGSRPIDWADVLAAQACLAEESTRTSLGVPLARALVAQARRNYGSQYITHLRRDLAAGQVAQAGGTKDAAGADPGLAHWYPAATTRASIHAAGAPPSWWVAHGGHITHVTGADHDFLAFAYPLAGTFEFSVDALCGTWAEGHAAFGGLVYEPTRGQAQSRVFPIGEPETIPKPNALMRSEDFDRLTFKVEPGRVRLLVNGHLWHEDTDPSPTSPWLALYSMGARQASFRNFAMTGKPEVPREVLLTHADRLDGWVSGFYNETQPLRRGIEPTASAASGAAAHDWSARDGVILGRKLEGGGGPVEGRLYYHRPLRDGDVLRYEFFYEPGEVAAHPALDRLAFLLEPEGVKVHWMTDGPGLDWTGLGSGNVADEPGNRRGPARLPLKPGAWNAVQLSLAGDTAAIELNGTTVYERALEPTNGRQFGLFHFKDRTAVRVRNAVLRGRWPETLTAEVLADLTARREPGPAVEDRRARHDLIGEEIFTKDAFNLLRSARDLSPAKRYEAFAAWVLPDDDHPNFRLTGAFTPFDPAPPVADPDEPRPGGRRVHSGGACKAPALELVALAGELGKLDELAGRVDAAEVETDRDRRGQLALRALVQLARVDEAGAAESLRGLTPLLARTPAAEPDWALWPELLATRAAMARPGLLPAAMDLANLMVENVKRRHRNDAWEHWVRHTKAEILNLALPADQREPFGTAPKSAAWSPVTTGRAASRGAGFPAPYWTIRDGEMVHYPGHLFDYLYLNAPLRGNFEVRCDLTTFDWRESRLAYAGTWVGIQFDLKRYEIGHYGRFDAEGAIEPPLPNLGAFYPYRLVVKDGTYTAYVADRKIHERRLPAEPDPWMALYANVNITGGARNLRISGTPTIPDRLDLSGLPDLTGWLAEYYEESLNGANAAWQKRGDEIVGRRLTGDVPAAGNPAFNRFNGDRPAPDGTPGSKLESLLQYHRPMLEDGEIAYEFFYEPGKALTHPALDRLTFLLDPAGVSIHWLTDAQHDRTGLAPDNRTAEPAGCKGSGKLPLKPDAWNRIKVAVAGDSVTLSLNDVPIFERTLEPTNQRVFGLFHYADESEVRVRNVTYRGQWPREFPADPGGSGR